MRCKKNGVSVVYGTSHVYSGDEYICHECGSTIVATVNSPYEDADILTRAGYTIIQMPEGS